MDINASGIYKITNSINGKSYIGSAKNFKKRWLKHRQDLSKKKYHSGKLQNSWNKYGSNIFNFEILIYCVPKDLLFFEQRFLNIYKPEYNICKVAGSTIGIKASEETKKKISESSNGRKHSETSKMKISESHKGKNHSEEVKQKMSLSHKGKPSSKRTLKEIEQSIVNNYYIFDITKTELAEWFNMSRTTIYHILNRNKEVVNE